MCETMVIRGGQQLNGRVQVPAAKNSVLPLLAAALLCEGPVRLRAVPRLSDVEACLSLLNGVGATARWQGGDIRIEDGRPHYSRLPERAVGQMRASILFAAPLLAALGRVETRLPGGCRIGARPIDLHLKGLARMGVQQRQAGERLVLTAPGGLHGAEITLGFASVGATETLILAGVAARGDTLLRGAAREPEIVDLAQFLNRCGAQITGAGTDTLRITGRRRLHGVAYTPAADRIFASTMACAAAAAGGCVEVLGCEAATCRPLLALLRRAGCRVEEADSGLVVSRPPEQPLQGVGRVRTGVYPGFATDAAPLLAAALLTARGASRIEDTIFENRFACAAGFAALGAKAEVRGRTLCLDAGGTLQGCTVQAPDLRGGAALALAALAAQGRTRLQDPGFVRRGYAALGDTLAALGAAVE